MAAVGPDLPTTFGKYYLTEKLATGGMAEIYLAKLIGPGGFEKPIVIKQIHPKLTGQRHFVDLFVAEAKILVTLAHGNIVPVYELGVVDDTYFIAMDYIDGPTLYRLTETMARRDAKMEPSVAAWITARILDGLDYAHRKGEGVIHRDLSPRNVMLSRDGEVKLVDFGIAVTLGDPGEGEASQSAPTGSFPYMSPEQVRRESLTPQTDLFSVGVLFWEMLVGQRLFARADADATLAAVLKETIPRPSEKRMDVPSKLDELAMRALERDQAKRWANAGEMRDAINRYLYSMTGTPGPKEVAALVAKFCPPETRRLPTHLEAIAQEAAQVEDRSGPATTPAPEPPEAEPAGPHTAVIPRDGSQPQGKRATRAQTFATHVDLQGMMQRAGTTPPAEAAARGPTTKVVERPSGPAFGEVWSDNRGDITPLPPPAPGESTQPVEKVEDAARPVTRRPRRPTTERPDSVGPREREPHERPDMPAQTLEIDRPPSRALLVLGGVVAIALSVAAVYMFYQKRDDVLHASDDAAVVPLQRDAAVVPPPVVDAAPPPIDAATPAAIDAAVPRPAHDAGAVIPLRPDATPAADAGLAPAATAKLTVGANPWGEVYIDGKKMTKHAPADYDITPGHHEIRVVFPVESPPVEKTFSIDVTADKPGRVDADFTH